MEQVEGVLVIRVVTAVMLKDGIELHDLFDFIQLAKADINGVSFQR